MAELFPVHKHHHRDSFHVPLMVSYVSPCHTGQEMLTGVLCFRGLRTLLFDS